MASIIQGTRDLKIEEENAVNVLKNRIHKYQIGKR